MAQALISTKYYVECGVAHFMFNSVLELKAWLKKFYSNTGGSANNSVIISKNIYKWDDSVKGFVVTSSAVTADELD